MKTVTYQKDTIKAMMNVMNNPKNSTDVVKFDIGQTHGTKKNVVTIYQEGDSVSLYVVGKKEGTISWVNMTDESQRNELYEVLNTIKAKCRIGYQIKYINEFIDGNLKKYA